MRTFLVTLALIAASIALPARAADPVTLSVLATTDLHGNLLPYDYFTAQPAQRGLARIATLIRAAREENPNSLLIDCGDTIQGAPLESVWQQYVRTGRLPLGLRFAGAPLEHDPMMQAMNALGYDSMTVGNHEFNFGLANLERARADARFPWLSANTRVAPGSAVGPFAPYIVKEVAGVKVAVIGITTPAIPMWERPEHYRGLTFLPGRQGVEEAVAALRSGEHPDLIVVAVHAGLERDPATGRPRPQELAGENMVYEIASSVQGIDAIVFGHTHAQLAGARIGDVLLAQPKNWGGSLARLDFLLEREGARWRVIEKTSRLIPAGRDVPVASDIEALARPYHELTERYLDTPVAESGAELSGALGRIEDTALVDAIQQVQLHYAQADVSLASLFNTGVRVPKGRVTVRQIAALYIYDNQLYALEGNGRMLREALENAARYYRSCHEPACSTGPLINRGVIGYNYDMAQGVSYQVDLTQPEGRRIAHLEWQGKPLADTQPLRIAVNNYRAGGSAGYTMFRDARIVWRSSQEIRDLIIEYYIQHKTLPAQPDNNWRVIPEAALEELRAEAGAEARRPATQ